MANKIPNSTHLNLKCDGIDFSAVTVSCHSESIQAEILTLFRVFILTYIINRLIYANKNTKLEKQPLLLIETEN